MVIVCFIRSVYWSINYFFINCYIDIFNIFGIILVIVWKKLIDLIIINDCLIVFINLSCLIVCFF